MNRRRELARCKTLLSLVSFPSSPPHDLFFLAVFLVRPLRGREKKKGNRDGCFRKLKEYRAYVKSISRSRNKLDDTWRRLTSRYALYFLPSLVAGIDLLYEKLYFIFRTRISPLVSWICYIFLSCSICIIFM